MDKDSIIIKVLEESVGEIVSGEELSILTGISRVAVRKRIHKMIEEGFPIEVVSRKGYRLRELTDILLPQFILSRLGTDFIGKNIIYSEVIDSTNSYAKRIARDVPEGTIVIAERQTSGRGRLGRKWYSPYGKNLYFSIILKPQISAIFAYKVVMIASVSLVMVLREFGLDALIKWPNDVYVGGKKISGILNEVELEGNKLDFIVCGVGVNVNIRLEEFPPDIRKLATSFMVETGESVLRRDLLVAFLEHFEKFYSGFKKGDFSEVSYLWRRYNYTLGKEVVVDGKLEGVAIGITPYGELLVRDHSGYVHKISAGDVVVLGSPSE